MEILNKIKMINHFAKTTIKERHWSHFGKKPFGWRDLDILVWIYILFKMKWSISYEVAVNIKVLTEMTL